MTTGVYCRPSCPSRTANPKNVQLHDTLEAAKATGFRPCKRCNPDGLSADGENAAIVARACRLIENSEDEPSLADLAARGGPQPQSLSSPVQGHDRAHAQGLCGRAPGSRVRNGLASGDSVTEAMYDAGFNSSGRFYEKSTDMLGMTPTTYRSGGANEEIRFAVGAMLAGRSPRCIEQEGRCGDPLGNDPDKLVRSLQDRFPKADLIGADGDYEALVARVVGFVEAPSLGLDLPLDIRGTAFQQRVWQALAGNPSRSDGLLLRHRAPDRLAQGGTGRRRGLRRQ